MYWIYLILFVLVVFTPEVISGELFFLKEDDIESVLIFIFGLIGLLLFLGKESTLLQTIREKLSLQQESNQIKKDLAQSYSYIGEMNRHLDILKTMIVESPHTAQELLQNDRLPVYEPVFDAAFVLAQSDAVALFFVREKDGEVLGRYTAGQGAAGFAEDLSGASLLATKKYWWQDSNLCIARSSEASHGVTAFLIFRSTKNRIEETGIFQILVTHALFLFALSEARTKNRALFQ